VGIPKPEGSCALVDWYSPLHTCPSWGCWSPRAAPDVSHKHHNTQICVLSLRTRLAWKIPIPIPGHDQVQTRPRPSGQAAKRPGREWEFSRPRPGQHQTQIRHATSSSLKRFIKIPKCRARNRKGSSSPCAATSCCRRVVASCWNRSSGL